LSIFFHTFVDRRFCEMDFYSVHSRCVPEEKSISP